MTEKGKYDRSISMLCPTCGGSQFEYDDSGDSADVGCTSCGLRLTKDDLIQANDANFAAHVDQVKAEVVSDLRKQFQQAFKGIGRFKLK